MGLVGRCVRVLAVRCVLAAAAVDTSVHPRASGGAATADQPTGPITRFSPPARAPLGSPVMWGCAMGSESIELDRMGARALVLMRWHAGCLVIQASHASLNAFACEADEAELLQEAEQDDLDALMLAMHSN